MLRSYFEIIRQALLEDRKKGESTYYEAHHIIPECLSEFGKNSTTVLLTAREHYRVHKILAECFKDHPLYKYKFLWAFHRMTYSGDLELSEEEYAVARQALMKLWKREKSKSHRENIGEKLKGNKNGTGGKKDWIPTDEQRERYSKAAIKRQVGKIGEESRASKGSVICENKITGEKIEAGSALQLSKILGNIHYSVLHDVLNKDTHTNPAKPKTKSSKYYQFLQDHDIYYKNTNKQ